jgi:hypothetical protein
MNLTIIAATGGIGRWLLEEALDAGQSVKAVVRYPKTLSKEVRTFVTDLASPDSVNHRSGALMPSCPGLVRGRQPNPAWLPAGRTLLFRQ